MDYRSALRTRRNARLPRLKEIFAAVEHWTITKTKFEAMAEFNQHDIPCGPILSMEELAAESSLRASGTIVEVDHPTRGKYLSVGNPIKMSDSLTEVTRSPLLGEHTDEVLAELGSAPRRDRLALRRMKKSTGRLAHTHTQHSRVDFFRGSRA
jgi:formyl-CoA transferase